MDLPWVQIAKSLIRLNRIRILPGSGTCFNFASPTLNGYVKILG